MKGKMQLIKKKLYCHKCNINVEYEAEKTGNEYFDDYIPDCAKCGTTLITEDEKQKIINITNNYLAKHFSWSSG